MWGVGPRPRATPCGGGSPDIGPLPPRPRLRENPPGPSFEERSSSTLDLT